MLLDSVSVSEKESVDDGVRSSLAESDDEASYVPLLLSMVTDGSNESVMEMLALRSRLKLLVSDGVGDADIEVLELAVSLADALAVRLPDGFD